MGLLSRRGVLLISATAVVPLLQPQWKSGRGIILAADAEMLSSFPEYCGKDMTITAIPSLSDSITSSFGEIVSADDVNLLQVHAIIRHGARGPFTSPKCWEGYDFRWDCNVNELVSPSLSVNERSASELGLFRKRYDAFPEANELGGTCMVGQLTDEGFVQEQENGKHLREAYVCADSLCLFQNDSAADLQESGALYLRSDDEQRTVMSGQVLTANMLNVSNVVLDWHTGDLAVDYISPNEVICPRLRELSDEAFADELWTNWTDSSEMKALNDSIWSIWGKEVVWWDVLDCLMTTACTARDPPKGLTEDLFEEAVNYSTKECNHKNLFNDSAYAKLAMAKLTLKIREDIQGAINGSSPLKFVLISGHDSTFTPFLSAVAPNAWDALWPPYASLSTIELLRIGGRGEGGEGKSTSEDIGSGDFFRFVYNGEVLKLDGCDEDICAIDKFLAATQFSVDLQDGDHCSCQDTAQHTTHSGMDAFDDGAKTSNGVASSSSLAPATVTSASGTASPAVGSTAAGNKTGMIESKVSNSVGEGSSGENGSASIVGIAFSCFVIGALLGAIPALLYFRRFRYQAMMGGGHSYEMT